MDGEPRSPSARPVPRAFVAAADLVEAFRGVEPVDAEALRRELDALASPGRDDPFKR